MSDPTHRISARDVLMALTAIAAGVIVSLVGLHTLELWTSGRTAFLVSHIAGLAVLMVLLHRGVSRRKRQGTKPGE